MEGSARVTEHRLPPMITPTPPQGHCRWCGGEITKGKIKQRNWHDGRDGEPNCLELFKIATTSAEQRRAVFKRDKGVCHDCGVDTEKEPITLRASARSRLWARDGGYSVGLIHLSQSELARLTGKIDLDDSGRHLLPIGPYCDLEFDATHSWEADHDFPLWLVDRTKPREEIIKYWLLGNLVTRCCPCHKLKSKEEAAARAKGKRIVARAAALKKPKKPGRQIQSRGFDKRYTQKLRTREIVPRRTP